jgi:hypothetical protein
MSRPVLGSRRSSRGKSIHSGWPNSLPARGRGVAWRGVSNTRIHTRHTPDHVVVVAVGRACGLARSWPRPTRPCTPLGRSHDPTRHWHAGRRTRVRVRAAHTHEVEVGLSAQRQGQQPDHLVQRDATVHQRGRGAVARQRLRRGGTREEGQGQAERGNAHREVGKKERKQK